MQQLYRIEQFWEFGQKWQKLGPSFTCMRKSFAEGAWAMLKAHYGQQKQFRLVTDVKENPTVIDTWNSPKVSVNCNSVE